MAQEFTNPPEPVEQYPTPTPPPPTRRSNTVWIIVAVVAVLLCCCCLVALAIVLYQNGDQWFDLTWQSLPSLQLLI